MAKLDDSDSERHAASRSAGAHVKSGQRRVEHQLHVVSLNRRSPGQIAMVGAGYRRLNREPAVKKERSAVGPVDCEQVNLIINRCSRLLKLWATALGRS